MSFDPTEVQIARERVMGEKGLMENMPSKCSAYIFKAEESKPRLCLKMMLGMS